MFSLRDSSSACSSGTDEDSFGWWIGAESHAQTVTTAASVEEEEEEEEEEEVPSSKSDDPSQQPQSVSSETSCTASSEDSGTSSGNYVLQNPSPPEAQDSSDNEVSENIELKFLGEDEDGEKQGEEFSYERSAVCYTPERLVKSEDFRILTPSPRFNPTFEELETARARLDIGANKERNGAVHLARLLQNPPHNVTSSSSTLSSRSSCKHCCPVRYGNGEVVLHTEHCPEDWNYQTLELPTESHLHIYSEYNVNYTNGINRAETEDTRNVKTKEAHQKIADDSSGISSVDGLTGIRGDDDWSCNSDELEDATTQSRLTSRRVSSELAYVSLEYGSAIASEEQNDGRSDTSEIVSSAAAIGKLEINNLTEHARARFYSFLRSSSPDPDYLARLALAVEPDVRLPSVRVIPTDIEAEIVQLRDKIDRLQGNNKLFYEEISSLKRDFAMDECKVNHLTEDVSKLQTEVHELRYLDDLLKLLKGELERISKRNWPFAIGHTKRGCEEINLII